MARQYIIKEEALDNGNSVYWLYYGESLVAEVFLPSEEENEEDFENGTYTYVCDLMYAENTTDEPFEEFFLTQEGVEKYRRTTELLPD